ncbi:hypothetical protein, partial [Sphingobacterium sp. SGG-5]|uniref:hypothetical protein n=1 Tax=Sphingobacterium sp. SGG-5 TaxID=2710881 RepID=UPI0019D0A9B3
PADQRRKRLEVKHIFLPSLFFCLYYTFLLTLFALSSAPLRHGFDPALTHVEATSKPCRSRVTERQKLVRTWSGERGRLSMRKEGIIYEISVYLRERGIRDEYYIL